MLHRRATDGIPVVGFDPSLRNWGIARGMYVPGDARIEIHQLAVTQAIVTKTKQVRQNSQDLDTAEQLAKAAVAAAQGAMAVFVEVPVGSQSARAMASYGVCVGVLGALRAQGIPFFEVSPEEVKLATGMRNASKQEMIEWAVVNHHTAPWPMQTKKGITTIVVGTAEHMADAVAAIHAGIASKSFKQMLPFLTRATQP